MKVLIDSSHCDYGLNGISRYARSIRDGLISTDQNDLKIDFFPIEKHYNEKNYYKCDAELKKTFSNANRFFLDLILEKENTITDINKLLKADKTFFTRLVNKIKREYHRVTLTLGRLVSDPCIKDNDLLSKYDAVHFLCNYFPKRLRADKNVIKCLTVHDIIGVVRPDIYSDSFIKFKPRYNELFKTLNPRDAIFTVSEYSKGDICNFNPKLDPNRVHVTHLGASEAFRQIADINAINNIKAKYKVPLDCPYVLGSFTADPKKNFKGMVNAFAHFVESEDVGDLILVLAGNIKSKSHEVLNSLPKGVRDRIILTDFVDDEGMAHLHSGSLCYCFPSLYEGFGLPVLEAMQCGAPVITSNVSSLPEIAGDAALLVNPLSIDEIAEAILKIYKSSELRKEMSEKGLVQAQKFSWKKCTDKMLEVYRSLEK